MNTYISEIIRRPVYVFNPLKAELNPICHLLALLGAHHIFYVSRIWVKHFSTLVHCTPYHHKAHW